MRIKQLKTSDKTSLFRYLSFNMNHCDNIHYIGKEDASSFKSKPIKSYRLTQSCGSMVRLHFGDYTFDSTRKK